MTDIAPLGFAVDTGDLDKGKAAAEGFARSTGALGGVMRAVAQEASAMATTMGLGTGGRLGATAAMNAAAQSAGRLTPQLGMLTSTTAKLATGTVALTVAYVSLNAALADNQDKWASYQQQLVTALGSQSAATQSLYGVVDIANEVGVSVDAALQSFNRFARARKEIGATNEELLVMTETIMKLGRAGGTSQGEMQGAMMQLSQALASGRLNGDELRSIMENMNPLARAIADGLGVSVGQLKRMGAEGELTSDKVFKALLDQAGKADGEFAKMPKTVEQAKTRMANAFDELSAHLGEKLGASKFVQAPINATTDLIEKLNSVFRDEAPAEFADNLKRLREEQEKLASQTKTYLEEFNKSFNKDTAKHRDLEKQREDAMKKRAGAERELALATANLQIAEQRIAALTPDIATQAAAGRRGIAFQRKANQRIGEMGANDVKEWAEKVKQAAQNVEDLTWGTAELDRQMAALARNDPFEKLAFEVKDLEDALANASGGMVDIRLQAVAMARDTNQSVDEIIRKLTALEQLRAERDVRSKSFSASSSRALATALAGGANPLMAEASSEAAQWAFEKFGDTVDSNTEIVRRYTGALIEMKLALQAVGDAQEITRLKTQLAELAAVIGAVTNSGGGGYAERLARHQAGIAAFTAERAGQAAAATTAAASGGASLTGVVNLLKGAFNIHDPSNRQLTGGKHVDGSFHYKGQAVDFVPKGGMKSVTKAQIRALMDANNINVLELLGPGDKGHSDHFHLAFGAGGGRTAAAGVGGVDLTGQVIGSRNSVFSEQERLRTQQFLTGSARGATDNVSRVLALREGGPEAVRRLELELKVQDAINDNAPIYAKEVEAAVRDGDAAERRLKAEEAIYNLRLANDNQSRRNTALATGDPGQIRALELQLRIEEIRRNNPGPEGSRLVDEARREAGLRDGEASARRQGSLRDQTRLLRDQLEIARATGDAERIAIKLSEARNFLWQNGISLTSELGMAHMAVEESLARQNLELEKQVEKMQGLKATARQTAEDIGSALGDAFGQATRTGKVQWDDFLGAIEEAFYSALDRMVQQLVISPIINVLTSLFTSGLNALFGGGVAPSQGSAPGVTGPPTALGRVFNGGNAVPFALGGGIFNTPTGFFMPGGRGLAGEGPGLYEAIMPLRRGGDGKLGVAAHGGAANNNTEINVIDMRAAGTSEAVEIEERQSGDGRRQVTVMIRDAVRGQIRSGGFDADFRGQYGTKRQVQRR